MSLKRASRGAKPLLNSVPLPLDKGKGIKGIGLTQNKIKVLG
jgi:hypothetical protein